MSTPTFITDTRPTPNTETPPTPGGLRGSGASTPPPVTPPPTASDPTVDPWGGLEGEDRDIYVAITSTLREYGLESLADTVLGFIQQGYSGDTVSLLLQETDAYKRRFSANEARRQKGLPVLSPAEYLATERAYRQVMSAAGLPVGYYDQPEDFATLMGNDVSPTEVQQRVAVASNLLNNMDPTIRAQWEQFYTRGDIVAYALDPERATSVLERQYGAAQAAAIGAGQGLSIQQSVAEEIGAAGVSESNLRQGMAVASSLASQGQRLSEIHGGTYSDEDAVRETFIGSAASSERRRRLASQERAAFKGAGGIGETSLARNKSGQI